MLDLKYHISCRNYWISSKEAGKFGWVSYCPSGCDGQMSELQNALQRLTHKQNMFITSFCCIIHYKTFTCVPCSLTVAQKVIRVDWFVDALKSRQVHVVRELLTNVTRLPSNVKIDNFEYRGCPALYSACVVNNLGMRLVIGLQLS